MRSVTHAVWVWGPAVFLMIAIFVFSSFSEVPVPLGGSSDLTVHGVVYALLGILMVARSHYKHTCRSCLIDDLLWFY